MDLNFEHLKIYFDGGSRGNPGPSAIGAVIYDKNDNIVDQLSLFIGDFTNNMAEYLALDHVLELIRKYRTRYNLRRIILFTDSKLLYSQLKKIWKIKDEELIEVYKRVVKKLKDYEVVDLRLIPRERNEAADRLVNKALDEKSKNLLGETEVNFGEIKD